MRPQGRGEVLEVGQTFCSRLDPYSDRLPPSQPVTNVGEQRASVNDYRTSYARTVPPWTLVSRRHASYLGYSPALTYVTVCTFAGLLVIFDDFPSHTLTYVCL